MKVGDLVKVYGTNPPLMGVVTGLGWNANHDNTEEMNWNPNPDVHIITKYGRRMCRLRTLELVGEGR